ncbi:MAG: hypothetical protein ACRYFU_11675, partial [Janthinobacterium lividum]
MRIALLAAFVAVCSAPLCVGALRAQEAPTPSGPPPSSNAPAQQETDDTLGTLKLNTNLVNVYFSARDKTGFITNLKKDDCQVLENKNVETIKAFTQEKKLPLTIGILLDTSGS